MALVLYLMLYFFIFRLKIHVLRLKLAVFRVYLLTFCLNLQKVLPIKLLPSHRLEDAHHYFFHVLGSRSVQFLQFKGVVRQKGIDFIILLLLIQGQHFQKLRVSLNLFELFHQFDLLVLEVTLQSRLNRSNVIVDLHGDDVLVFLEELSSAR